MQHMPFVMRLAWAFFILFWIVIAIHMTLATGALFDAEPFQTLWRDGSWRVDVDHSVPEHLEFVLLLVAAAAMAWCWQRTRAPVYAAASVAGVWMLTDGYFRLHEQAGSLLTPSAQWRGELAYFGGVGAALGTLALLALRRTPREHRRTGGLCLGTVFGIAVCAVALDAVSAIASSKYDSRYLDHGLVLAEDGGELAFIMLFALLGLAVARRVGCKPPL